ncbi:putative oxidoreductase yusZ [Fusarium keratoplasticum]|uniref:Oxidoreductase yusZ n=1 Tax=Fusarium keratoplasticum TaxID=1328300 RepID=A0ACC0QJH2_9HYPO|nr:putative oxidoreductase yusZ [Fusarium keratoplasticum]KAI8657177.1 putative oxidoreductase yusZ [Fusarium keratoplasticum]KAI8658153.1 putative oxidoreductase yusZ [Fusarium keratoplasticum]
MTSTAEIASTKTSKVWLVTGCSTGLGRCLVPAVLARGDKIIATARQVSTLKDLENDDNVRVLSLDVTADQTELAAKVQEAQSFFGRIDVLVNNAGCVISGVWEELSANDMKKEFDTNFFGALNMTRAVLPFMRSQKSGIIMFMGSIAAWHSAASGGLYASSKCALEGAVESLSREVSDLGIRVHIFVLGRFRTGILGEQSEIAKMNSHQGIADYARVKNDFAHHLMTSHDNQPGDPFRAAEKMVDIARVENLTATQVLNLPLRIPLGAEAVDVMRRKCLETLAVLDGWDRFSAEADFEDSERLPAFFS